MTRYILKAIDIGGSAVFLALSSKAFCVQFYNDVKQRVRGKQPENAPASPPSLPIEPTGATTGGGGGGGRPKSAASA
jgi:hypothetical protein